MSEKNVKQHLKRPLSACVSLSGCSLVSLASGLWSSMRGVTDFELSCGVSQFLCISSSAPASPDYAESTSESSVMVLVGCEGKEIVPLLHRDLVVEEPVVSGKNEGHQALPYVLIVRHLESQRHKVLRVCRDTVRNLHLVVPVRVPARRGKSANALVENMAKCTHMAVVKRDASNFPGSVITGAPTANACKLVM